MDREEKKADVGATGPRAQHASEAVRDPYAHIAKELTRWPNPHAAWDRRDPDVTQLVALLKRILAFDKASVRQRDSASPCVVNVLREVHELDSGAHDRIKSIDRFVVEETLTICPQGCVHRSHFGAPGSIIRALLTCSEIMGLAAEIKRTNRVRFRPLTHCALPRSMNTGRPKKYDEFVPSDDVAFEAYYAAIHPLLRGLPGVVLSAHLQHFESSGYTSIQLPPITRAGMRHASWGSFMVELTLKWGESKFEPALCDVFADGNFFISSGDNYDMHITISHAVVEDALALAADRVVPIVVSRAARTGEHGYVRSMQYRSAAARRAVVEETEVHNVDEEDIGDDE